MFIESELENKKRKLKKIRISKSVTDKLLQSTSAYILCISKLINCQENILNKYLNLSEKVMS